MKSPPSRRIALIAAVLLCCCTGSAHAGFSGPPPGGDPGGPVTRALAGEIRGKIKLLPAGADFSWCASLRVTALVQHTAPRIACSDDGVCRWYDAVTSQWDWDFFAEPAKSDRSAWRFHEELVGLDASTRVELSARCEPAWEYRFKVRAVRGGNPFALGPGEERVRNLKLRVSHRPSVTRTVTLLPTLAETRMHATAESFPGDSCRAGDVAPQAPLRVGFYEWFVETPPLFCRKTNVYQSALYFDLAEIAVAPRVVITEAVLHAGEDLLSAHGANAPLVGGCVSGLGLASTGWSGGRGLVANEDLPTHPGGEGAVVTAQVIRWLTFPETNLGFVVKGQDHSSDDGEESCLSSLEPALVVTYVDLPDVPVLLSY